MITVNEKVSTPGDPHKPTRGVVIWVSNCRRFARVKKFVGENGSFVNEYQVKDLIVRKQ